MKTRMLHSEVLCDVTIFLQEKIASPCVISFSSVLNEVSVTYLNFQPIFAAPTTELTILHLELKTKYSFNLECCFKHRF